MSTVSVDGLTIAFVREGEGPPVLLVHGWPTSSFLWREIVQALASAGRSAIALDLPGFGASDKPPDAPYTLDWYAELLEGFLRELGIERTALCAHDLGGPIGLLWAVRHSERLERLVVLDTLLYPRKLLLLRALLAVMRAPGAGALLTRPAGLGLLLRAGVARAASLREETRAEYLAPFAEREDQHTLRRALLGPRYEEFDEIAAGLDRLLGVPTLIAWADRDLLLPRSEMRRIARALPHAKTTIVARAGHFLQEDQPDIMAAAVADFLAAERSQSVVPVAAGGGHAPAPEG